VTVNDYYTNLLAELPRLAARTVMNHLIREAQYALEYQSAGAFRWGFQRLRGPDIRIIGPLTALLVHHGDRDRYKAVWGRTLRPKEVFRQLLR